MEKIEQTLNIIFGSSRRMPAHFTSNEDRTQSFCIDFDPLTKDDDETMAAQSWGSAKDYIIDSSLSSMEYNLIMKCGEENMIGSYVLVKLGGENELDKLQQAINENFIKNMSSFHSDIKSLFAREDATKYFNYCCSYGCKKALEKNS